MAKKLLRTALVLMMGLPLGACLQPEEDPAGGATTEPALETSVDVLDAALSCTDFDNPDKEPVLLIHGTGTYAQEQFDWNYLLWLRAQGFDVCMVSYPDRGFGDQQIAAEYVVHAVRRIHAESGRRVDMVGHSQGGSMPRWAIKWWPSVQQAVDDFVMHAPVNHGTSIAESSGSSFTPMPASFFQFAPNSNFVTALNAGDETPGEIDYTSIFTVFDELVQPQVPESTSALDLGQDNPRVSNILLQDICPGRMADHASIGLSDYTTAMLTLDALVNDGPADFERAGGLVLCVNQSFVDDPQAVPGLFSAGEDFANHPPSNENSVSEEPELKPYARDAAAD